MGQRGLRRAVAVCTLAALVACEPAGAGAGALSSVGSRARTFVASDGVPGTATADPTSGGPPIDGTGVRTLLVIVTVSGGGIPVAEFSPIYASEYLVPVPAEPSGDFSIVAWKGDAKIAEVSFASPEVFIADCDPSECQRPMYWITARVPIGDAAYTRVELFHLGASLGFVDASAHAPVVGNVAIAPAPWGGDICGYDASDADGDALSSIVTYSTDGGATWDVLSQDDAGGALTVDAPALPPSPAVLCRVEVSDGVLSASAEGGPFGTANTAPDIWPASELDATAFVSGNQTLQISMVFALDNNSSMPSSAITWRSSIDGTLPGGGGLDVRASDLSEGLHVITITATDENGATGAWSGVLRVQREYTEAPAPPITNAETVALLRTLAGQSGLKGGVAAAVDAAIAGIETALAAGNASRVCAAFGALGDPEGTPGAALSGADHDDAGSLAGLAGVLGEPHGCTSD